MSKKTGEEIKMGGHAGEPGLGDFDLMDVFSEVDMARVMALLTLNAKGKTFCGVAVLSESPKEGDSYGRGMTKLMRKQQLNIGFDVVAEYGMSIDTGKLSHRKILEVISLTEQIQLVTFEGCFQQYNVICVQNNWMNIRRPTQIPSPINVAFSDKAPEMGHMYTCTVVEKLNGGETAANQKSFNIVDVKRYGENLALCKTDSKPLLVVYSVVNNFAK